MAAQDRLVKNEVDLQNIVTMTILKKKNQENGFKSEDIVKEIKANENFNDFCSEAELMLCVIDTMYNFIRNGYFSLSYEDNETYYPSTNS